MACLHQGLDITSYENPHHPLQLSIKKIIASITDQHEDALSLGIDGCSLPSFAIPLEKIALAYARLAYWQDHAPMDKPSWLAPSF